MHRRLPIHRGSRDLLALGVLLFRLAPRPLRAAILHVLHVPVRDFLTPGLDHLTPVHVRSCIRGTVDDVGRTGVRGVRACAGSAGNASHILGPMTNRLRNGFHHIGSIEGLVGIVAASLSTPSYDRLPLHRPSHTRTLHRMMDPGPRILYDLRRSRRCHRSFFRHHSRLHRSIRSRLCPLVPIADRTRTLRTLYLHTCRHGANERRLFDHGGGLARRVQQHLIHLDLVDLLREGR